MKTVVFGAAGWLGSAVRANFAGCLSIIVLRPDYIVDSRLGMGRTCEILDLEFKGDLEQYR